MRRSILLLTFLFCSFNILLQAQNEDEMKAWMEYMSPSWGHELLSKAAGEWTFKMKYWTMPDAEPMTSEGTSIGEMILGGRYLKVTTNAISFGMPMEGISIEAFDNAKQKFYNIWIDNLGTGMMHSEGTYDESTGEIVYQGKMVDPMTSEFISVQTKSKMLENEIHFEMWMDYMGNFSKTMEIVYTRK